MGEVTVVKEAKTGQAASGRCAEINAGGGLDAATVTRLSGGEQNFVGNNRRGPLMKWLRGAWTRHFAAPSKTLAGPEPFALVRVGVEARSEEEVSLDGLLYCGTNGANAINLLSNTPQTSSSFACHAPVPTSCLLSTTPQTSASGSLAASSFSAPPPPRVTGSWRRASFGRLTTATTAGRGYSRGSSSRGSTVMMGS